MREVQVLPITLVVPVFNEEKTIETFLYSIGQMNSIPSEILLVDSGSSDNTNSLILKWFETNNIDCDYKILGGERSYPGKSRNKGVQSAKNEWIAFIDVGVVPDENWLNALYLHCTQNSEIAAWGFCKGIGRSTVDKAICAVSFGTGRVLEYVIPASIFSKKVFDEIGGFPEDLRAAEDVIWRRRFLTEYGNGRQCSAAIVYYDSFPTSLWVASKKWFVYAINTATSKINAIQELGYLLFLVAIVLSLFISLNSFFMVFSLYLFARGVIDPIRRSGEINWFRCDIRVFLMAIVVATFLDFSKIGGFLVGNFLYLYKKVLGKA